MKRILELLSLAPASDPGGGPKTDAVRRIVEALAALDAERAQFLAAFAYLLGRVAHADLDISGTEIRAMEMIVEQYGDLPPDQARLVVEIVRRENQLWGGTQNFQVAREFRAIASREQRKELIHCLFAISAADHSISGSEEKQVRQVADEMGLSHREYVEIRSQYNDKRSVVQRLRST